MKKLILTLTLVFAAGLFSTTALALTSNTDNITVVKGDKDKKKKKSKKSKKGAECTSATGEKKSCCSHGTAAESTEKK
jgi:predicted phosphodiesterase|tara:strand:- start:9672 stop:9905 length:234 start_codon:yes stop_codon:yes gene_type:complete